MADYYDANAAQYLEATVGLRLDELYRPFLALIPRGGRILDAGCGSGRDSKRFREMGYAVTAFDASRELARRASEVAGIPVVHLRFDQMSYVKEFDGIWACASMLHVPSGEIPSVMKRCFDALKVGGVLYVSFKAGNFEGIRDGRYYTDYTKEAFHEMVTEQTDFHLRNLWLTSDVRPGHESESWLNALLVARPFAN